MKRFNYLICLVTVAAATARVTAAESVLDRLSIGVTTPKKMEKLFAETRTEIPDRRGEIVVHFKDDVDGISGVCRFFDNRLYRYDVSINREAQDSIAAGGWKGLVTTCRETLGTPIRHSDSVVMWNLEENRFQLEKKPTHRIIISLCNRRIEKLTQSNFQAALLEPTVRHFIHGGPHFFNGVRPDITRTIKLSYGVYSVQLQYEGRGNFIVIMQSASGSKLIANTIGRSRAQTTIRVTDPVMEVFFSVEHANGPWKIRIEKVRDIRLEN